MLGKAPIIVESVEGYELKFTVKGGGYKNAVYGAQIPYGDEEAVVVFAPEKKSGYRGLFFWGFLAGGAAGAVAMIASL